MKNIGACSVAVLLAVSGAALAQVEVPDTVVKPSVANTAVPPAGYNILPYITLSTSPYLAVTTAFDASDVWSQQSSMNEDLFLLQYRDKLEKELNKRHASLAQRPIIELSGAIEGVVMQTFNDFHNNGPSGDVNLNTAELDVNAMISKWAIGFMSIAYDSAPPQTGNRVTNSRLFLSRGFATIGNLEAFPLYFTIGQTYLPFGRYSSNMVTSPVTLSLARINDRTAILGYYKDGIYAQLYVYPGIDSNNADTVFHEGGLNVGIKRPFTLASTKGSINFGGGIISDMTDSQGIGNTGASSPRFPGFTNIETAEISNSYPFEHVVPGADIHSEITYGSWSLALEFVSALARFSNEDLTFNGHGASPKASHVELARTFPISNYTYTAGGSYGRTWEAVGLNLPQQSFTVYVRTSFWKNTITALEFRHDIDYSTNDESTAAVNFGSFNNTGTGKSRDMILAQLGVYF